MPSKPKSENGKHLDDKIVVLVAHDFKAAFYDYCREHGVNPSEVVRDLVSEYVAEDMAPHPKVS